VERRISQSELKGRSIQPKDIEPRDIVVWRKKHFNLSRRRGKRFIAKNGWWGKKFSGRGAEDWGTAVRDRKGK